MKYLAPKYVVIVCITIALLMGCRAGVEGVPKVRGTAYYVDCAGGDDSRQGTKPAQAWQSLEKVNSTTFKPGDGVFLKRGTRCAGTLWPKGSGSDGFPITLSAYGTGPLPIIEGGKNEAVLKLSDQAYWHIQDLETSGGTIFGVLVTGSKMSGRLRHFRLTNLVVHDVYGGEVESKTSGLVIFMPGGGGNAFDDVVLDGITAYNTNQWAGISILGSNNFPFDADNPGFGTDITVRNSTVYNTYGDGITLFYTQHGLIESSVAFDTGQKPPPKTIGTPASIWTWACYNCIVQFNESYRADTPEVDGGCYDIDWGTRDNLYQYNYGHDSVGYCLSFFGADNLTTSNAVARYNICANNGRDSGLAARQGDIFFSTWNNGHLDGVQVYNNTIYWNPARSAPVLINHASFVESRSNIFANNLIYSSVPWFIESVSALKLDHNLYWYTGDRPVWFYDQQVYISFNDYQKGSGQDAHGIFADPHMTAPDYHEVGRPTTAFNLQPGSPAIDAGANLGDMGKRDFFGNPIPFGSAFDIGAHEFTSSEKSELRSGPQPGSLVPDFRLADTHGGSLSLSGLRGHAILLAFVDSEAVDAVPDTSRSQVVFLRSMARQYAGAGVRVLIVDASRLEGTPPGRDELVNRVYNWHLEDIPLLIDRDGATARQYGVEHIPATFLIGADGRVIQRWDGMALPAQMAFNISIYLLF